MNINFVYFCSETFQYVTEMHTDLQNVGYDCRTQAVDVHSMPSVHPWGRQICITHGVGSDSKQLMSPWGIQICMTHGVGNVVSIFYL